jgi:tRNA(adenine34) deaminase
MSPHAPPLRGSLPPEGADPPWGGPAADRMSPALLDEVALDDRDGRYLRQAIAWSRVARDRGNRPFGAVVIADDGRVLAEAYCNTNESGDCTGHAETNAVRQLGKRIDRETLARATLYSSAEPCVMCAGAIFWSAIGRVVYGIDAVRLRVFRGERAEQRDAELSCRDVFAASPHAIECIGPALIDEASEAHRGVWKA